MVCQRTGGWSGKQLSIAILMVFTGSLNTLSTKWADNQVSENSAGEITQFNHPFFQADGMFLGEITCMITFYILRCYRRVKHRNRVEMAPVSMQEVKFPPYIFYGPAFCDMLATSTMYLGLTLTYASSFQMLRGAVIVFTGLLSTAFLGKKLRYFNWLGIALVIVGLVVVGVSDLLSESSDKYTTNGIITGDLLIIAAQVVSATQMVIEEKYLLGYNVPPLKAVGWEGTFGFITLTILLVPFYYIPAGIFSGNPRGVLEDPIDAFVQLSNNGILVCAVLGNIISIAFFNFAGISVTKELSATTRMVLDSVRTLVIWLFSLAVGWQAFYFLQPIGFGVLVIGMFFYNDALILPFMRSQGWVHDQIEDLVPINSQAEAMAQSPEDIESSGDIKLSNGTSEKLENGRSEKLENGRSEKLENGRSEKLENGRSEQLENTTSDKLDIGRSEKID